MGSLIGKHGRTGAGRSEHVRSGDIDFHTADPAAATRHLKKLATQALAKVHRQPAERLTE